jgi:hypothetical protein
MLTYPSVGFRSGVGEDDGDRRSVVGRARVLAVVREWSAVVRVGGADVVADGAGVPGGRPVALALLLGCGGVHGAPTTTSGAVDLVAVPWDREAYGTRTSPSTATAAAPATRAKRGAGGRAGPGFFDRLPPAGAAARRLPFGGTGDSPGRSGESADSVLAPVVSGSSPPSPIGPA